MDDYSRLRLFENVALDAIEGLLEICPIRQLQPGEVLISQRESSDVMYLLLAGRLRIHLDSLENNPVRILETGESVGELAMIDRKPTSVFVVADQHCRLLTIDQEIFWALINASHEVAKNLLIILAQRLRDDNTAIVEGVKLQQLYKRHATIDALTGLYNRRWLNEILTRQVVRSSMDAAPLSVIMVDIDHFRAFNGLFGHAVGDQVLYNVAQTLASNIRPTDIIARYGGEEFVVVLPDTDEIGARIVAERLRKAVGESVVVLSDESILPPVSVSLSVAKMAVGDTVKSLLTAADTALCRAKNNGRNCVVVR